jgi:hypothetical protein
MCSIVILDDHEIETPREFIEAFGVLPEKESSYKKIGLDECLCQCDLEATFQKHEIKYCSEMGGSRLVVTPPFKIRT